jgi:signal transduction histidine kinase/HPt (histidine-containing phosphotransfer) domain-containing protein
MIPRELASLRILLVDDDAATLEFEAVMLQAHGFENLSLETNPRRALVNLNTLKPDLILLDYIMGGMTGMEFLRELRELLPPDEFLPVIMVTSEDSREIYEQAMNEGAADFLTKPIQRMDLVLRVRNLLRTRWQHLQLVNRNQQLDREILAHRQLADNLYATTARFGALLRNLQVGVLVVDENRRRVLTNAFFGDLFDLPNDTLTATWDLVPMEERICVSFTEPEAFLKRTQDILAARALVTGETWELTDGRTIERDFVPVFQDENYFGHLWTYRDISKHRQEQAELANARDAALRAASFKASFMANMSHEIRTPINGVLGMLGLLADSELSTDQRTLLNTAQSSADALLDIINDVLDYSKIEAGKLPIQQGVFTPAAVLEECLMMVARAAEEKGLELSSLAASEVPKGVRGDGGRVRQVLTNLLSNAVKFTGAGEVVAGIEVQGNMLRFSVTDTGIGVTPDEAAQLFRPFVQADASTTRRYGGTGLGLAISRQLVEMMGGELDLTSVPGEGSTFWFTLPMEAVEVPETEESPDTVIGLSDMRVMVIQDNATVRNLLLKQLESWRMLGQGARTGREALQAMNAAARAGRPFHTVLVDAQLPDSDASVFAREVKADPALTGTKLVLMTALYSPSTSTDDFSAVIAKPVRQSQLYNSLLQLWQPDSAVPMVPADTSKSQFQSLAGISVLLVDDSAVNREVARRWLEKWGCEVSMAVNGREAFEAVQQKSYDLVLMDCQMPEMDGYAASRAIRTLRPPLSEVPIIALTAHALEGDSERCLAAGMDAYLAKPIRPATLNETVAKWTKRKSRVRAEISNEVGSESSGTNSLDGAALQELREAVGEEGLEPLAEMFFEQVRQYQRSLRSAVDNQDWRTMNETAHALRGLSQQFGAETLACECAELESMNEGTSLDIRSRALEQIDSCLAEVKLALNQFVAEVGRNSG